MCEPAAVDVECGEDLNDGVGRNAPGVGPADDVEVLLTRFETVQDAVQQQSLVLELALQQAEVAAVQLDPEALALEVLDPAGAQEAPPVTADPVPDGRFAQVVAGFLALNPLELLRFLLAVHVNAGFLHG